MQAEVEQEKLKLEKLASQVELEKKKVENLETKHVSLENEKNLLLCENIFDQKLVAAKQKILENMEIEFLEEKAKILESKDAEFAVERQKFLETKETELNLERDRIKELETQLLSQTEKMLALQGRIEVDHESSGEVTSPEQLLTNYDLDRSICDAEQENLGLEEQENQNAEFEKILKAKEEILEEEVRLLEEFRKSDIAISISDQIDITKIQTEENSEMNYSTFGTEEVPGRSPTGKPKNLTRISLKSKKEDIRASMTDLQEEMEQSSGLVTPVISSTENSQAKLILVKNKPHLSDVNMKTSYSMIRRSRSVIQIDGQSQSAQVTIEDSMNDIH
jgi:hypothetical protein